ncbi:hypothetical protein B0J11DRAFT_563416 [Dendryphion nanum]|uniref:Secreted protein n=1 Tax=Dendryphion nanum TaxID=256645 RepID=A0A9P9EJV0_9PLEO|nr:hypothetical protein B0J11DRAFT_563416 [Dendryphion nanum]
MRPSFLPLSLFVLLTPLSTAIPQSSGMNAGFTKGIFATFDDANCGVNQRDVSDTNGGCHELPGQSMKIWWLRKGCGVVTLRNQGCKGEADIHHEWNKCISTKDLLSWSIYLLLMCKEETEERSGQ